jgi:hypothetical protein
MPGTIMCPICNLPCSSDAKRSEHMLQVHQRQVQDAKIEADAQTVLNRFCNAQDKHCIKEQISNFYKEV